MKLFQNPKMSDAISKSDLETLIQLVNAGDVEELSKSDFEQFQYQGFDPFKIVESLLRIKKTKNVSDGDFSKDVYTMVAVGMIKGSINDHNMTKMSDEGKTDLKNLMEKYGIQKGGGKGKSSNLVTFPRVMATFPDVSIRLVSVIGPKEFRGGPMLSTYLPEALQVQVFPAIIPRDIGKEAKLFLMTAALCYSIDQTIQISNIKEPNLKEIADTQARFVNVGHQSPVPSEAVRSSVFKTLDIANQYEKILIVLTKYRELVDPNMIIITKDQLVRSMR